MNNTIELEKRIEELNNRLEKLERIEKRRKTMLIIKIILYIVIIVIISILIFKAYIYINDNIIKPLNNITNIFNKDSSNITNTNDLFKYLFGN